MSEPAEHNQPPGPPPDVPAGSDAAVPADALAVTPLPVSEVAPGPRLPPRPTGDPYAHRKGEPRTFAALWVLYLFGCVAVSLGSVGVFGLVALDVYRPAARLLMAGAMAGVIILWPLVRLSQEFPERPARAMALDVLVVSFPVQALVWPQCLPWMAGWPLSVVAALALSAMAWTLLVGGVLALVLRTGRGAGTSKRWNTMLVFVVLAAVGPALAMGGAPEAWAERGLTASPIGVVFDLTRDSSWSGAVATAEARHWGTAWVLGGLAAALWVAAVLRGRERRAVAEGRGLA